MNENINIVNRFNLKSAILSINKMKNGVSIVTQNYQAFTINIEKLSIENLTSLAQSTNLPHKYSKSASCSDRFVCICEIDSKIAKIAKIDTSIQHITDITTHKSDISASCFSSDEMLLSTGGEDGRIHLYTTNSFKKILSLPYRPDYISSLHFSSDSRFLFASCFNKSNIIFDCQRAKTLNIFNTNDVIEWGAFFDNNSKVFLISRNLSSLIYDTRSGQITNIANPFTSWPTIFCLDKNEKIALIGSRDSTIYLININDNAKIFQIKLENIIGISAICLHLGYIFVGGSGGELMIIKYDSESEVFQDVCNAKDYKKISQMLESNIFLSLLDCAKVLEDDWEGILKETIELLSQNKINEAIELANPFMRDPARKSTFEFYLNKKSELKRFCELIDNKYYEEAYNMSMQLKFLLKTTYYETLEGIWHKAFNAAKKVLEEDSSMVDQAKRYLDPFMKTPKKEAIMQLLNNLHIFKDAENFLKEQNFKDYFSLTFKFGYLKDTELYKKVSALGDNFFENMLQLENSNNYDEFYKIAKFLQSFPVYKHIVTEHIISVDKKLEMLNFIRQNNKFEVYKLAIENEELQYLDEFRAFCKSFDEVYASAIDLAFKGQPQMLDGIFGDYMRIKYWSEKITETFKVAYMEEFKNNARTKRDSINWEQSVKNYIQIFGKDDEIIDFCDNNNITIDDNELPKQPFRFQKSLISNAK